MSGFDYDLLVIGAGSAGVRLARMSAAKGARVAVAEDRYLGGTCVNVGCVPKKLFVYAAEVREQVEHARGFGWASQAMEFDWLTLRNNKTSEIERLNGIYRNLLENSGARILEGRARFVDTHRVEINGESVSADKIVIATGSWPFVPDFVGSSLAITSNELFYLESLPKSAVVLGGGYIAVEMAGILNGLGVSTSLIYRGELFLRGFDEEVRHFVKTEIEKKGIDLVFQDNIREIQRLSGSGSLLDAANQQFEVILDSGKTLNAGLVLAATGRKPHLQDLGMENIAVTLDPAGNVQVDNNFRTSEANIFALGDVTGGAQLTPVALAEGMYLSEYLFGDADSLESVDYGLIPTAVFCQPNIATVGMTEEEALKAGRKLDVFVSEFRPLKHTVSGSDERCFMKLLVDRDSQKVLGAHMVGHEAGEIIQGVAIAMKAGATKQDFDRTIGIHPDFGRRVCDDAKCAVTRIVYHSIHHALPEPFIDSASSLINDYTSAQR